MAVMSFGLVACGDDDDEEGGGSTNVLVGTWRYDFGGTDYSTYTFNSDGSGEFRRPSRNVVERFSYKITEYDASSGEGKVLEVEGGKSRTIDFTLMDARTLIYEGGMVYRKVN